MTDDFDVSLRRRLESLAESVPVSKPGEIEGVTRSGIHAGVGMRLGFAGLLPVLALIVGGALLAGLAQIGPFGHGLTSPGSGGTGAPKGPIEASIRSGDFVLSIRSAKASYDAGEPTSIEASLTFNGSDAIQIAHGLGGAGGPVGFGIEEPVLGGLQLGPTTRDACVRTALQPGQTLTYGFAKSGTFDGHDPSGDDYKRFFEDPELRLTTGTWHVYAVASFSLDDCSSHSAEMRVAISIEVGASTTRTQGPLDPPESVTPLETATPPEITLSTLPEAPAVCSQALGGGMLTRNPRTGLGFGTEPDDVVDVTWPYGWSARVENNFAFLIDESGRIVAREGDQIMAAGGWGDRNRTFTACGLAPWAGTPMSISTAPEPQNECLLRLGIGVLARTPATGLGIVADVSNDVRPVRWPFGYTARDVYGRAVLFDQEDRVVAWEGGLVVFGDGGPAGGVVLACGVGRSTAQVDPFPLPGGMPTLPPPIEAERVEGSAIDVLFDLNDGDCIREAIIDRIAPDLNGLDLALDRSGGAEGMYTVNGQQFVHGSVEIAAAAFGGKRLVVGSDGAWVLKAPGQASELRALRTPAGREVWEIGNGASLCDG